MKKSAKKLKTKLLVTGLILTSLACKNNSNKLPTNKDLDKETYEQLISKADELCNCYDELDKFIVKHGQSPEQDSLRNELIDLAQYIMSCEEEVRSNIDDKNQNNFDTIFLNKCTSSKWVY
jgi:cytidylate kinase